MNKPLIDLSFVPNLHLTEVFPYLLIGLMGLIALVLVIYAIKTVFFGEYAPTPSNAFTFKSLLSAKGDQVEYYHPETDWYTDPSNKMSIGNIYHDC